MASASRDSSRRCRPPRLDAPSMMFSFTVRPGNTRRPSGTCEMPIRTIASGPSPAIDLPSNRMSPEAGWRAGDRAQRRRLAGAVGAEQGHHLPFVHAKRNAAQRFDFAVADNEIADFEQRHRFGPEIGGDDIGMAQHRHGFAVRDRRAEIEHGDMLGRLGDQRHVVVDDQDGQAVRRDALQQRDEVRASRSSSGRRRVRRAAARWDWPPARARSRSGAGGRRRSSRSIRWRGRRDRRRSALPSRARSTQRRRPCRSWCCRAARRRSRRSPAPSSSGTGGCSETSVPIPPPVR